ncbi:hypothetical protein [Glycomyces albidus]|uniref:Uncharacterized protein n=1 Tax=Glycomyces albidus TaxID=2656774 RepID=A0A6L5G7Q5_9ACTN|nr:hypothetical protein [Glycomyces albidus]MQM25667.1 hypothetical protein [Glycomyces albidus]
MPHMEAEQLIKAANELFQIESDAHAGAASLAAAMAETSGALASGGLSMGEALGGAAEAWAGKRMKPTGELVVNLAEFLTVYSQEMVDLDEFTGNEFEKHKGLVQRRSSSNVM